MLQIVKDHKYPKCQKWKTFIFGVVFVVTWGAWNILRIALAGVQLGLTHQALNPIPLFSFVL